MVHNSQPFASHLVLFLVAIFSGEEISDHAAQPIMQNPTFQEFG
jgi:hypothetical protein